MELGNYMEAWHGTWKSYGNSAEAQRGTWKLYGNGVELRICVEIYGKFMEFLCKLEIMWK